MKLARTTLYQATVLGGTALASSFAMHTSAYGQTGDQPGAPSVAVPDIIVTAQKRQQNLQDVPIAITALTADTIQANRVTTVGNLTGLAPGVTVRTSAGGSQIPTFAMRGVVSYGVVPGSDKEVSIYLDGVYISSAKGGIFDLPDISRIEILRGPQGTLFGRNATAGAVSITTRDPTGKFGAEQDFTVGNYDQFRSRTSLSLPAIGPFSGYVTYVHNYKRGDILNAGAGQVWDRSASPGGYGKSVSPEYLGTQKTDSVFAAIKFAPTSNFTMVYKFDRSTDGGTPDGTAFVGLNPGAPGIGGLIAPVLQALFTSQPGGFHMDPSGQRPDVVNNSWVTPTDQLTIGHNLTSTWRLSSHLTVKNILAYRHSQIFNSSAIDGFSGLALTQQAILPLATFQQIAGRLPPSAIPTIAAGLQSQLGQPFVGLGVEAEGASKQWSDEFQVNFESRPVTVTAGGMWFHSRDRSNPIGLPSTVSFSVVPGGVLGGVVANKQGVNYNGATSLAAYAQVEGHLTSQLDLVGGIRLTDDVKTGQFAYGVIPALTVIAFRYHNTKPSYMIGVNFKPNRDTLLYAKYSTSFVSGGSVAGIDFAPETAYSSEAGIKADLLDRRLRANLAVYNVIYDNLQSPQGANNFPSLPNSAVAGSIIISQGRVHAKGFEFELTAAPARGTSLGGNLSYTDTTFSDTNAVLVAQAGGEFDPNFRSKWTGDLWGMYETNPLFGDTRLMLRMDATYHSRFYIAQNQADLTPSLLGVYDVPASWTVNGRAALRDIAVGSLNAELAVWVKNMTQNREASYGLRTLNLLGGANFVPARTFGADLNLKF